jgi:hypothetical protein
MTYGGIVIAQAERSLRSFAPWGKIPTQLMSLRAERSLSSTVERGQSRSSSSIGLLPVPRGAEQAERRESLSRVFSAALSSIEGS